MKKVKLKVLGISYSQSQSGAYALVLVEEKGPRRIPIIIGGFEAQAIVIKLENLNPPRPLTHDLFKSFADAFSIEITEVFIYKLEEGIFFAKLICYKDDEEIVIDSRTSDAVALALRLDCPIFTTEEIMEKAGITIPQTEKMAEEEDKVPYRKAVESSVFDTYTDEDLYKMIDEAVKTEDYERAAAIRDELEKRKRLKT